MFVITSTILNYLNQKAEVLVSDLGGSAGHGIPVTVPLNSVWSGSNGFIAAVRAALVQASVPGADTAQISLDGIRPPTPVEIRGFSESIDKAAGEARKRYVTVAPGQSATYVAKALEAERYMAAGAPLDMTGYPLVKAEMDALGYADGRTAATNILQARDSWLQKGAQIELLRLKYKNLIRRATTIQDAARLHDEAITALSKV